ncbi:hypothetical protein, partial [Mycobacteroides abscessus]|uniref:hypothetical protein n=1 Tax=Mycobacteroides abscessus TaxID=36809 RepID=UPI000695B24D
GLKAKFSMLTAGPAGTGNEGASAAVGIEVVPGISGMAWPCMPGVPRTSDATVMDGGASDVVVVPPEHADSGISMVVANAVWRNEDKNMGPLP